MKQCFCYAAAVVRKKEQNSIQCVQFTVHTFAFQQQESCAAAASAAYEAEGVADDDDDDDDDPPTMDGIDCSSAV